MILIKIMVQSKLQISKVFNQKLGHGQLQVQRRICGFDSHYSPRFDLGYKSRIGAWPFRI